MAQRSFSELTEALEIMKEFEELTSMVLNKNTMNSYSYGKRFRKVNKLLARFKEICGSVDSAVDKVS